MKASAIRVRLKSTKQIVEVDARDINQYGELRLPKEIIINGEKYYDSVTLKPSTFEIIPEQDFYDFRNNTARHILGILVEQDKALTDDELVDRAVSLTDKLIAKL